MQGIMVFRSLKAAIDAGYQVYDRCLDGYLVRTKTDHGWALGVALVRTT